MAQMEKQCSKCKITKTAADFYRSSRSRDGLQYRCKDCMQEYCKVNKDRCNVHKRKWAEKNSDWNKELKKKWVKDNPNKRKQSLKKYYESNKHKEFARAAKRRADLRKQTPEMSPLEKSMIDGLYLYAQLLSKTCGEQYEVDHVIPISRGGLHCWDNLQILHWFDNRSKGGKLVDAR